jgi:hypothetical protein
MGSRMVLVGQSHAFQAWHRDQGGGRATSKFSSAVAVKFL